jgi:hypothetical protein
MNDFITPPKKGGQPLEHSQPDFLTPEAASAHDQNQLSTPPAMNEAGELGAGYQPPKPKTPWYSRWRHFSKKQWIIIGVIAALLLGAGGYAWYRHAHQPKPVVKKVTKAQVVKPAPVPIVSNLTGLPADDATNNRPVTAIMIENSPDARPQASLKDAGVVFEAIAEGGITRFLTLWQDTSSEYIGPVRSVRPYYLQWLSGFNAAVAHVGGSGDALANIKAWGIKDLDQFSNPGPYWRVNTRFAPHNMYTSLPKLWDLEAQKGFGKANYTSLARKVEAPSKTPTTTSIDFNISGALYNSHYDYDAATNTYKRSEGGKPHVDEKTGEQIAPKVVVGLVMQQGSTSIYTTYQTIGSGQAFIFQDGTVTPVTWHKDANEKQFTFTDANGGLARLDPGKTWFSVVGGADRVSYK